MLKRGLIAACIALLLSACAASTGPRRGELEAVRDRVQQVLPEVLREDVRPAAAGLYEIQRGSAFGYVTADGRYFLRGDLIDLHSGEVLTESRRREFRAATVQRLDATAIVYAPPAEQIKQTVHIFVDVDCDYCRQLHKELPAMNAKGIAVRYLFYPRRGEKSEGYGQAQNAYCAADPRIALDTMFSGRVLDEARTDCENPVAEQYRAALSIGVRGTPAIILPDGSLLYGYQSASGLQEILEPAPQAPTPDSATP